MRYYKFVEIFFVTKVLSTCNDPSRQEAFLEGIGGWCFAQIELTKNGAGFAREQSAGVVH
jgi:hypothetical protein